MSARNFSELITQRRTVHRYADTALPPGTLARALECAISAPNHGMTEPWRFVLAGRQARTRLIEIGIDIVTRAGALPLSEAARANMKLTLENPAELLVVSQVLVDDDFTRREDYAAIACAIQNLSLALWADGIGSKWLTGRVLADARTYQALHIDARLCEIVGFVLIGYPARSDLPKARRKLPMSELLRSVP